MRTGKLILDRYVVGCRKCYVVPDSRVAIANRRQPIPTAGRQNCRLISWKIYRVGIAAKRLSKYLIRLGNRHDQNGNAILLSGNHKVGNIEAAPDESPVHGPC